MGGKGFVRDLCDAIVVDGCGLMTSAVGLFPTKSEVVIPLDVADEFTPPFLQTLEDLGVGPGFLADLALKTVSLDADCTTARVAQRLRAGVSLTNKLLEQLVEEKLIEKKGMVNLCNYRYGILERGWAKVDRLMDECSLCRPCAGVAEGVHGNDHRPGARSSARAPCRDGTRAEPSPAIGNHQAGT